jgi:hypothetical protein
MEVGKKTATCPILKKENSYYTADTATTAATNSTLQSSEAEEGGGKEKKHVEWDEHAIEEHDLLRGTRMKVSQPMMMMMMICYIMKSLLFPYPEIYSYIIITLHTRLMSLKHHIQNMITILIQNLYHLPLVLGRGV